MAILGSLFRISNNSASFELKNMVNGVTMNQVAIFDPY